MIDCLIEDINPRLYISNKLVLEEAYAAYISLILPELITRLEEFLKSEDVVTMTDPEKLDITVYTNKVIVMLHAIKILASQGFDVRSITIKWFATHDDVQKEYDADLFADYI